MWMWEAEGIRYAVSVYHYWVGSIGIESVFLGRTSVASQVVPVSLLSTL